MSITKYEHTSTVLHLDEKHFALTGRESLQGLTRKSASTLSELGEEGWELVSVVPYSRSVLLSGATKALLGFFRRARA